VFIDSTDEKDGAYAGHVFCQARSIAASHHIRAVSSKRSNSPSDISPHVYIIDQHQNLS